MALFCRESNCRQSVLLFLFIFGTLQFSIMALSSIFRATLTFVEKQFQIDSKTSGFITSGNELASLLLILPVTYFGCRLHRPFCIGAGGIIVAVSYACLGLPHFFMPAWHVGPPTNQSSDSNESSLCISDAEFSNVSSTVLPPASSALPPPDVKPNRLWVMLFLAQLVVGVGASHIYSYGASYIDDFADKARSPLYFGILMSLNLLGPGFGHVFGAWTSSVYVDVGREEPTIPSDDPRWVGAWWLGPIIMSVVVALGSSLLFIFPKRMKTNDEDDFSPLVTESVNHFTINDAGDTKKQLVQLKYWDFVKAFPQVTMRLLRNPVFTFSILCFGCVMALVAVIAVFQPKYMQEEFGITSAHANFLIGAVKMPMGIVGTLSGGAIMGRLKLNLRGASVMVLVIALLSAGCLIANFFIGCETRKVASITADVNESCVSNCDCDLGVFDPVCGDDGIEYFNPCQAGCTFQIQPNLNATKNAVKKYADCKCLSTSESGRGAIAGTCKNLACVRKVYIYTGLGAVQMFLSGLLQAPTIMILLRSIAVEDKAFGLGIMMLAGRLMGWIPMPPLTGALIDSTCLSWTGVGGVDDPVSGAKRGACRLYDAVSLRNKYWGLLVGLDAAILVFYTCIVVYVQVKKLDGTEHEKRKP